MAGTSQFLASRNFPDTFDSSNLSDTLIPGFILESFSTSRSENSHFSCSELICILDLAFCSTRGTLLFSHTFYIL